MPLVGHALEEQREGNLAIKEKGEKLVKMWQSEPRTASQKSLDFCFCQDSNLLRYYAKQSTQIGQTHRCTGS